jgi:hypothetical protein
MCLFLYIHIHNSSYVSRQFIQICKRCYEPGIYVCTSLCPLKSELLWVLLTPRARPVLLELMAHSEVHERRGGVKLYVNYLLFLMT